MGARDDTLRCDECERIANQLHDTVVQQLFAIGLSLHTGLERVPNGDTRDRIEVAIEQIDVAIRDVRSVIDALQARHDPA
jgi:signal transduction histidine kinase